MSDRFIPCCGWLVCTWCFDFLSNCSCSDQDRPSEEEHRASLARYDEALEQLQAEVDNAEFRYQRHKHTGGHQWFAE